MNSAHRYNWVNLGGAVNHPEKDKGFDVSSDVNDMMGLTDSGVKVIASDGYGTPDVLRMIIKNEKGDA